MSGYRALRRRTYEVLEKAGGDDRLSAAVDVVLIVVIVANMAAVVLESFDGLYDRFQPWFYLLEVVSVALFTVELLLRLWTCDFLRPQSSRVGAVGRFLVSPIGIIDLLAILPFYLPFLIPVDLRVVRVLRLVRFLRLLKLTRYTRSVMTMGAVVRERRHELLVAVFLTVLLLMVASTLMYYLESQVQPEAFPQHPVVDVVGGGDAHHHRLRRRVPGDRLGPAAERHHRHPGDRPGGASHRHHQLRFRRSTGPYQG